MTTIRSLATEFNMQPHELVAYTALDQLAETDELNAETETFIRDLVDRSTNGVYLDDAEAGPTDCTCWATSRNGCPQHYSR